MLCLLLNISNRPRVANNFKTPGAMWAPNLSCLTSPHWYFGHHIFNEMLKAVKKLVHPEEISKLRLRVWLRMTLIKWTVWLYKMFYQLQIVKTKVKFTSRDKPQSGSGKFQQNFYSPCVWSNSEDFVADKKKYSHYWVQGQVVICNPETYLVFLIWYTKNWTLHGSVHVHCFIHQYRHKHLNISIF